MKYDAKLLDYFSNPKNVGSFTPDEKEVHLGIVGSYERGALIHLQIKIHENVIEAAKFKAYGNAAIIAACSFATEWIQGKTVGEALQLSAQTLIEELHIPEMKLHCALLVEDALKKALGFD